MKCPSTGKVMHKTRANAKKACRAAKRQYHQKKHPYLCEGEGGCGSWHIGDMPLWKREGRAEAPGGRS